ncbi:MAG: 3-hydroxylacyl-ACP dehydratase [Rhodocyclaceae bacterium]|nr:3-hydroxylacyl-ACP dehydratase [Rhodocyclaceae bacterium]
MPAPPQAPQAPLDRAAIAARIPHQDSMCLLDTVTHWSAQQIRCTSTSHLDADNPLRADGRLGIACGIEYAAQAMAVHGVLLAAGPQPKRGYLVSVRSVTLAAGRLDELHAPLEIEAERLSGDSNTVLYQFHVRSADRLLLNGRAAVVLDSENL